MKHQHPLEKEIYKSIPASFISALRTEQAAIYQDARAHAYGTDLYEDTEAQTIVGIVRRGVFECRMRNIAALHGLPSQVERIQQNGYPYTVVKAGRFLLTSAHVPNNDITQLTDADYRRQHSAVNELVNQLELFPMTSEPLQATPDLYAVILHCDNRPVDGGVIPGFLKIGVPNFLADDPWLDVYDSSEFSEPASGMTLLQQTPEGPLPISVKRIAKIGS